MNHTKLITRLEGFRSRNSVNHCYINKDVYRLLYCRESYYIAYNNIKSNDGAETVGSDNTSLHGFNSNFRRIKYVRYADDFLIGIIGDKQYAKQLKLEIKQFLIDVLHLKLSVEKTQITNALHDKAKFLGYHITKRHNQIAILMDTNEIIHKLHQSGMCDSNGYPRGVTYLLQKPVEEIILKGNQILRGHLNNNQGCNNYYDGWRIQYIIQYSIAKTIARKYDISMKQVFKKYGNNITCTYHCASGLVKIRSLALYKSFRRNTDFFKNWLFKLKEPITYTYKVTNPLYRNCYICGNLQNNIMFHRKKKSRLSLPHPHIIKAMLKMNRRQVCLCDTCFQKVENNELEYNQIYTLRKLT